MTRNRGQESSPFQVQVAASAGLDFATGITFSAQTPDDVTPRCCRSIRLHADGTLEYKNYAGVTVTLTNMVAGLEPIEASAITTNTNVKVTCYF